MKAFSRAQEAQAFAGRLLRTDNAILEGLVILYRIGIPFILKCFSAEVFNGLVVQQAIRVNPSGDLGFIRK